MKIYAPHSVAMRQQNKTINIETNPLMIVKPMITLGYLRVKEFHLPKKRQKSGKFFRKHKETVIFMMSKTGAETIVMAVSVPVLANFCPKCKKMILLSE